MFPRSFLFFILIMIIDLILKTVKDKKKIEEAKVRKMKDSNKTFGNLTSDISPSSKDERKNTITKEREISPEKRRMWKEPVLHESYGMNQTTEIIDDRIKEKKIEYSKEKLKKDVLMGIIFSEILSEPKSLENKRKSI